MNADPDLPDHPLGEWAQFPKIVAITEALMSPAFVLAKLAMNPSREEPDTIDDAIAMILHISDRKATQ